MKHTFGLVGVACIALAACNGGAADGTATANDAAVQEAIDRIAIEAMVTEYYAHLGGEDSSAFDRYFTEDAVFDVNGIVANGRDEIEGIYTGMREDEDADAVSGPDASATGAASSEEGYRPVFHMILSNPVIQVDGDRATASFLWTGIQNETIDGPPVFVEQGREYDKLVKVDGEWKFSHRVVLADSGMPESMNATYRQQPEFAFPAE